MPDFVLLAVLVLTKTAPIVSSAIQELSHRRLRLLPVYHVEREHFRMDSVLRPAYRVRSELHRRSRNLRVFAFLVLLDIFLISWHYQLVCPVVVDSLPTSPVKPYVRPARQGELSDQRLVAPLVSNVLLERMLVSVSLFVRTVRPDSFLLLDRPFAVPVKLEHIRPEHRVCNAIQELSRRQLLP